MYDHVHTLYPLYMVEFHVIMLQIDASERAYCIYKKNKADCFERAALNEFYNDLQEQSYSEEMQRQNTEAQSTPAYHQSSNYDYGDDYEFFDATADYQVI